MYEHNRWCQSPAAAAGPACWPAPAALLPWVHGVPRAYWRRHHTAHTGEGACATAALTCVPVGCCFAARAACGCYDALILLLCLRQGVESALLFYCLDVVAGVVGGSDASTALRISDASNRLQYTFNLMYKEKEAAAGGFLWVWLCMVQQKVLCTCLLQFGAAQATSREV